MVVRLKSVRPGDIYPTNKGGDVVVVSYTNNTNVLVEFLDSNHCQISVSLQALRKGLIKNPYTPNLFGVGFIGVGPHKSTDENGKLTRTYNAWSNMLERCHYQFRKIINPSYQDAYTHDGWHNFQVFAEWYTEQHGYYEIDWQLDKDLLGNGSKLYSPETCRLLPPRINAVIKNTTSTETSFILPEYTPDYLPNGVSYHEKSKAYMSTCAGMDNEKLATAKYFKSPFEAFRWYKESKEQLILELANFYKEKLDPSSYDKLLSLKVLP